jgi:glutaredoxin 2
MTLTLYHYVHCPFCVRVRLALGHLNLPFQSVVVPYDDEATPLKLTGKKMLPILAHPTRVLNESLDIIELIDEQNKLRTKEITNAPEFKELEAYLNFLGSPIHSLAMPYWIWTPEFNDQSRSYFQKKKEEKRGPFQQLVKNRTKFIANLEAEWPLLEKELSPFYRSSTFGLPDILLAAHLWGLYVVPEFQFPPAIHLYLQRVKELCHFDYHEDFWK